MIIKSERSITVQINYTISKPVCCRIMDNALASYVVVQDGDKLAIYDKDDTWPINYCPFCGEQITIVESNDETI